MTRRCDRHVEHWLALKARKHREWRAWREEQRESSNESSTTGYVIPIAIVMCESGGHNLSPNSAGASGVYQIIPETWASYGGQRFAPEAYQATEEQQSIVAARIWNHDGPGAWVCKA